LKIMKRILFHYFSIPGLLLILIFLTGPGLAQITDITFYPFKQFLLVRETKELPFVHTPEHYSVSVIEFNSSDTNILTVDDAAYATGKNPGWAYVMAKSKYSPFGDLIEVHVRDDNTSMKMEAEEADLTSPLRVADDPTASGGKCLVYDSGPHSQSVVPDSGHVLFTMDIDEEGFYIIYVRLKAFDRNNNSFYVKVDTFNWQIISAPDTVWSEETKESPHSFTGITEYPFFPGEHTVELAYRQPGVKLDYIRLIRDSSSVHRYESHYSGVFGERRWINVMLPSYYDLTDARFPVMIFSHGWGGRVFRQSQGSGPHLNFNRIQERIDEDSVIFVMTDGKIEWFEDLVMAKYSPYNMVAEYDLYYEDYFPELFDYLDDTYRTIPGRQYRAVMGHSMGGGMVLRLGQRSPDLVAAVQPTCAGANHLLGTPDRLIRYYSHEFVKNMHGTHVRIFEGTDDYLNEMNVIIYDAMERERLEHLSWEEIETDHDVDVIGTTVGFDGCFDFMLDAMNNPLPPPGRWHHADFRPGFQVWDYTVNCDMERLGFLDFTGITKGGMKIFARKWLPDGPGLAGVTIDVTTAPLYKVNSSYTLLKYDFALESTSTETVISNGEGRISFSVTGSGTQVGIYDSDTPPEIVLLAYRVNDAVKYLTQGAECRLKIQVLNRGGQDAENITIDLAAGQPDVIVEDKTLSITSLASGAAIWLDETVGITADYDPPARKSPVEVRLNAAIGDGSGGAWQDEVYIPVMFNVPLLSNFNINDNIPEGTQNRVNGFAEPGERIILETALGERLRLQYDDEYVVQEEEEVVFPDKTLSYSVIRISENAPVGHKVTFQARLEEYDASVELVDYTWKKIVLEITDHTSVKEIPDLEKDPSDHVTVYPNPVTSGQFMLELGECFPAGKFMVVLTDMSGRTLFREIKDRPSGTNRYTVTTGDKIPHGVYVVTVEFRTGISRTRLVIR
jgi:hypothetical protein